MKICTHCGAEFETASSRAIYCGSPCKQNAFKARKARGENGPILEPLAPEVLAWLDALSVEFDRAVRTDWGYVVEFAEAGAKIVEKRGGLTAP